tara:strand:+ start:420 stop:758 length:339 start_codon:yes stop_codon:yes gene_type:complete
MIKFEEVIAAVADIVAEAGGVLEHFPAQRYALADGAELGTAEMWQYDGYDSGYLLQAFKGKAQAAAGGGDHISLVVDTPDPNLSYNMSHPCSGWIEEYAPDLALVLKGQEPW